MSNRSRGVCLVMIFAGAACTGGGGAALETFEDSASYAVGVSMGSSLRHQAPDIHQDQLVRGIEEALAGEDLALGEPDMMALLQRYARQAGEAQQRREAEEGQMHAEAGRQFLEDNGARAGVTTTASGLQYEVVREGKGPRPKPSDVIAVRYRGTLTDGTEFDSTDPDGPPVTFAVNGVIAGWTEALQLMTVGSLYKLYIPGDLAYGSRGSPPDIPPNATLIFEVELLEIQ